MSHHVIVRCSCGVVIARCACGELASPEFDRHEIDLRETACPVCLGTAPNPHAHDLDNDVDMERRPR